MKSLSGIDSAFLYLETPATPMHVASLHLFDLPPGYRGDFQARIKRAAGQAPAFGADLPAQARADAAAVRRPGVDP